VFLCWELLSNNTADITVLGTYCQNFIIWCLCQIITYSFQSLLIIGSYCAFNHISITCLWHLSLSAKHLLKMSWTLYSGIHCPISNLYTSLPWFSAFFSAVLDSQFDDLLCKLWDSFVFLKISMGFASHFL